MEIGTGRLIGRVANVGEEAYALRFDRGDSLITQTKRKCSLVAEKTRAASLSVEQARLNLLRHAPSLKAAVQQRVSH